MSQLFIRKASVADAAAIATLFSEFNAILGADGLPDPDALLPENTNVTPSTMAGRIATMAEVEGAWLAEANGTPAGLMCLRLVPYVGQDVPYAEVTQLYVRAAVKRQGVGAALLATAEDAALQMGATCVHIITGYDNIDAQAFYRAKGYDMPGVEFVKYLSPEAANV